MVEPIVPVPSPFPNIHFPTPYWINRLKQLILITCSNPALMFVELALPAALQVAWTIATPSTKQIVTEVSGKSWVCQARTLISNAESGDLLHESGHTRFMYGLWRGLDVFAYYQFMGDVIGQGLINWHSMVHTAEQRCTQDLSPFVGVTTDYGTVYPNEPWSTSMFYFNRQGHIFGAGIEALPGGVWTIIAAFRLTGLFGSAIRWSGRIRDLDTGTIYDEQTVDNLPAGTDPMILAAAGAWPHDAPRHQRVQVEIRLDASPEARVVGAEGHAFVHVRY